MPLSTGCALSAIQSKAISTSRIGIAFLLLLGKPPLVAAESSAHMPSAAPPHICVVVAPGETRPEFGCFRIGIAKKFIDLLLDHDVS